MEYSGYIEEELVRFVGEHHPIMRGGTIKSTGAEVVYAAGTVMGLITAEQLYVPLDPDAVDGSQGARRILTQTVAVPAADNAPAQFYVHGEFFEAGLTWPDAISVEDKQTAVDALDALGIYVV